MEGERTQPGNVMNSSRMKPSKKQECKERTMSQIRGRGASYRSRILVLKRAFISPQRPFRFK